MVATLYDHQQEMTARLTRQLTIFMNTTFFALLHVRINVFVLASPNAVVGLSASHALLYAHVHALTG